MANLVYERVIQLINEQRLTKAKVEAACGLGNGTIEGWKEGKQGPSINSLEKVAGVLGVSLEELVKKED